MNRDESEIREKFMAIVYEWLSEDGTNSRANHIIGAFDDATAELTAALAAMTAERDAFKARAEAAEADMKHAAEQSERGEPSSICVICEDFERDDCGGETCHFKWRGPVAGNKPKTLTEAITKEINKEATTP